jgi:hypothetical protein
LVFFYFVPEEIREERSILFEAFLGTNTKLSEVEMYDFHRHTEEGNQKMAW